MCFGGSTTDKTVQNTATPNSAVASTATNNLSAVTNLENTPFQPYSGNQVAQFGGLQSNSFDEAGSGQIPGLLNSYANTPVQANTISSQMNPYLNQYVNYALAPQIQGQNQQFAAQDQQLDAAATSSGAFGDARAGIQQANLTNQQNLAQQGLIGSAYNSAFNTAIGAGAQDVSNNLQAQMATNNQELQGANALQANIGFQNQLGQQQTAQTQAGLNANYNQWLMGQQRPFQTAELANQSEQAGAQALPASTTQTTSSPDNSGWGFLGSIAGPALGAIGNAFLPGIGGAIGGALGSTIGGAFSGSNNISAGQGGGVGFGANGEQLPGNFTSATPYGYAEGGVPPVGLPSMVGEKGPELFAPHDGSAPSVVGAAGPHLITPHKSGTIIPNDIFKRMQDQKKTVMEHANKRKGMTDGFDSAFAQAA